MRRSLRRPLAYAFSLLSLTVHAQAPALNQPPVWSAMPDIVAFERMVNDRLAAAQSAIDHLLAVNEPRSIENTVSPYDEAIRQLHAAFYLCRLVQQVHPDASCRDHATAMAAKVNEVTTAFSLNQGVYRALVDIDLSDTDAATRHYVERQLLEMHLAGVAKDAATRAKLQALQKQLSRYQSIFVRNISDDVRVVVVNDLSELDGLPQDYLDSHKPGPDGKIRITTAYPDLFPVQDFANSDALLHRMADASNLRAYPRNREVLQNILQTRYKIARLLGYASWADYNTADKMIGTGRNIAEFIEEINVTVRPIAQREYTMMLAEKRKRDPRATQIMSYEFWHLLELVRRAQFHFDSQSIRPYLPYAAVKQGVMDTAASLFHVRFRQELNAPAWDPSVETWDVLEGDRMIGRFYLDMHPRPGKYSHDESLEVLAGVSGKQLPEGILVCNFPASTATDPGLMEFEDVEAFFHEFGHLMHTILGGQHRWAGISGITMESDFEEAPSQMLERFMQSPQILASFARHYQTGEVIPADLVSRMNRTFAFGRAGRAAFNDLTETAFIYEIHKDQPQNMDLDAINQRDNIRYSAGSVPIESDAHQYASSDHLASAEYSPGFYSYLLDRVIAADFYEQFDQGNLLAGDAPMRYRRTVLEPGGWMSGNDLIRNFLGRPWKMTAFRRWLEEEFAPATQ
jgi:thimet oligopeptidase